MGSDGFELINAVGNNLFSVAVAAFLLLRMEKRLSQLTDAINGLKHCQTCTLQRQERPLVNRGSH